VNRRGSRARRSGATSGSRSLALFPMNRRAAPWTLGAGNVTYSVDYPSESMTDAAEWLDASKLDAHVRAKIEPENARASLKLD
jgi:predicted TIM-barrel fold metal-dependent hydrolase